jgi:MOSC domain-containing protein YiiM
MLNLIELKPGLLVQDGNTVLKVSTVYQDCATFAVELPIPARTTVVTLTRD